jgi:FMN phosphatase YigB (HAD superfamily)
MSGKKNLLLCLDAFGTLFHPYKTIPEVYAQAAARHGINVGDTKTPSVVGSTFSSAFKKASQENPNYGKATGMGARTWWSNVIEDTFKPFLSAGQPFPPALTEELLRTFSSNSGYNLYPDVLTFFRVLRAHSKRNKPSAIWPWNKTIVGIITNSDDRVSGILNSLKVKTSSRRYVPGAQKNKEEQHRNKWVDDVHFTVLSYDVGFEKPDRRIFIAAERMLALTLDSTGFSSDTPASSFEKLYVGDDLMKDVFGAEDAGWSSVLVKRDQFPSTLSKEEFEQEGETGGKRTVSTVGSLMDLCAWRPGKDETSLVRYALSHHQLQSVVGKRGKKSEMKGNRIGKTRTKAARREKGRDNTDTHSTTNNSYT